MKRKLGFVNLKRFPGWLMIGVINAYRYAISPFLGNNCRFHPSCSEYAVEAVSRFGILKGSYLALRRLLRCHPWCEGGIDHLPEDNCTESESH